MDEKLEKLKEFRRGIYELALGMTDVCPHSLADMLLAAAIEMKLAGALLHARRAGEMGQILQAVNASGGRDHLLDEIGTDIDYFLLPFLSPHLN